jgi:ubiquinone/menaquinone biosynthesis C-methylase UbiE
MTIDRALAGIRARVPGFSGMKAGDRVLDVCCGTGAQSFYYASKGITSWGIDMDAGMIEFAERRRGRLGLNDTFFQRASAGNLPFRDACFDHASISMGLHEKTQGLSGTE